MRLWPGCSLALLAGPCHDSSSRELGGRGQFEAVSVLCSGSRPQVSPQTFWRALAGAEGASLIASS